jgi:Carbon-nitrogen hydrolase
MLSHFGMVIPISTPCAGGFARQVTEFRTVRVAAVQATPVILDATGTVDQALGLIADAAADGAELVVLPEAFVPLSALRVPRGLPRQAARPRGV